MSFEQVLKNPDWKWDYDGVYIFPHIPMKKLSGAISAYAPSIDPLEVLVLLDDTVFGGAREGMIVTRDGLYAKQKFEEPRHIHWRNIRKVEPETNSRVRVNGDVFFKADIIHHFAILALASRLNHFVADSSESSSDRTGATDPLARELQLIHRNALNSLARHIDQEYEASELELPSLIDAHFQRVMQELPKMERAVMRAADQSSTPQSRKVEVAACALLSFIIFHASAFSRTPDAIKDELGEAFFFFAGIHMQYRDFFLEGVDRSIGVLKMDMQEFFEIAAMLFMVKDGETDFQLNISREEALAKMISVVGLSADDQLRIEREFDATLKSWWLHIEQLADAGDEDEDEEHEGDDGVEDQYSRRSSNHAPGPRGSLIHHAEVLGIRPGASRNEIELAYRGRRSQYHPDRYAGEGPEAVAWATGKMKEVNTAYQALVEAVT
ncbi:J domain-containing protein [Frateuria soli]|uniref:J domain-containing protein n=1 Tax=Frateuria soli TaxID=1542730 RepID=UPI001E369744|nr:J domain-containing protein [Frateuria soli]UGB37247.1 J domain-containing protein [Frateuria soli]